MTINVLGAEYTIAVKKYDEDKTFKQYKASGYCSGAEKEIVLCDMATYPDWEDETIAARDNQMKKPCGMRLSTPSSMRAVLRQTATKVTLGRATRKWWTG